MGAGSARGSFPTAPDGSSGGTLTDVTGSTYINVTTPMAGVRNVALNLAAVKAALLAAPSVELWVDFGAATDGNGSEWSPWNDPASMTAWIATQSSAAVYRVNFMGRTGAHVGDAITWPTNYLGVFEGTVRGAPTIGNVTMSAKDGGQTVLLLRNIAVNAIVMENGTGLVTPGVIVLLGENSGIDAGGIDSSAAPDCQTIWQLSGNIASGFQSGGLFNAAYCSGPADVQVAVLDSVRGGTLRAATLQGFNCFFDGDITLYDQSSILTLCGFAEDIEVIFDTVTDGILKLDSASTYKWRNAGGTVSAINGGSGAVVWYHEMGLPCDFAVVPSTAAGDLGKTYRQDPASQTVTLAQADTEGHCAAVYGPWQGDDDSVALNQPVAYYRMEPGLTLANGDKVYLSRSSAGLHTNVESTTPGEWNVPLADVWDASDYDGMDVSGSAVRCVPNRGILAEVPTP